MLSVSLNSRFGHRASAQAARLDNTVEKLSSGLRINRAADDAAGLRVAENLRAQARGAAMASQNLGEAVSLMRFALDGLQGVVPVLQRMRELTVQAANGTNSLANRQAVQTELDNLRSLVPEAYLIARDARVNLNGATTLSRMLTYQVGANQGETITVDFNGMRNVLGNLIVGLYGYTELYNSSYRSILDALMGGAAPAPNAALEATYSKQLQVATTNSATIASSLSFIDTSIRGITGQLAYLGGMANDLQSAWNVVSMRGIQAAGAESLIRDADMASESSHLARQQVLRDSAIAAVSHASLEPRQIARLLHG